MQTTDVFFGEWLPSAPDFQNPGCIIADNVIPAPNGSYAPVPGLIAEGVETSGGAALSSACRGAALFFNNAGTPVLVGGTDDSLFTVRGSTLAETAGLSTIGTGSYWDFAQFNSFIVATNIANAPQALTDVESDDSWSDLAASAPNAAHVARVEDFLMLGNIASFPNRVQWSPFNSPAGTWGTDRLTQAGYADLPLVFGPVRRIIGGRYPLVFQERGISRLDYIGPPVVWRVTEIEQARGCAASFAVVTVGFLTFFLSQDGFYVTDGAGVQPIGSQRVNRWFFDTVADGNISETHAAVDWRNECVVWAFKAEGSTGFNRQIRYSWSENRWASGTLALDWLTETTADGVTLEELSALYPDLDTVPVSLDDPRWKERGRVLAAFASNDLHTFSGLNMAASFETGEFQPVPGRRVFCNGARPLGEGGQNWTAATIDISNARASSYSAFTAPGADGFCPLRADGQTMRLAAYAPPEAEWTQVQGLQPRFRVSGRR